MDKMKCESPDLTQGNIDELAKLFPSVVTEGRDENGELKKAVNFEALRQLLSSEVLDGDEAYEFTWVGKKEAIVEAGRPIRKTLRPSPEESKNWETTENLYIEGDNLDVLKLLQENYLGKVKMIYIDPPYNTGNDFIYKDDFAMNCKEYDIRTGAVSENEVEGRVQEQRQRLFRNTDSNGRFHSDWCSMIYPRLMLARNLLSDDGVIFLSCDDNEQSSLCKICDTIFGNDNFVAQIIWKKRSTPPNDQIIGASHEYILIYVKNNNISGLNLRIRNDEQNARYKNPDNHPKGAWVAGDLSANTKGGRYVESLNYPIENPRTHQIHYPPHNGNWRFNKERMAKLIANDEIYFGEDDKGRPKLKRFLCDVKPGITYTSLWDFVPFNTVGSTEMREILGHLAIFDNPKPHGLIKELLCLGSKTDSLILDFFSGSATTAHAVMQLNAEDGGKRQFIMVQLPEVCPPDSEAAKAGYKNICEIGKERIRRAAEKIKQENAGKEGIENLDVGFRVLKCDSSNMKDVYYAPKDTSQDNLDDLISNIKEGRTDLDLLFGCLVEWGLPLSLSYKTEQICGYPVHFYDYAQNPDDSTALAACFDANISEEAIKEIAKRKPLRAVFRDSSFATSEERINAGELFKTLAPDTAVKVI